MRRPTHDREEASSPKIFSGHRDLPPGPVRGSPPAAGGLDAPSNIRMPALRSQVAPPLRSPPGQVPEMQFTILGQAQEDQNIDLYIINL